MAVPVIETTSEDDSGGSTVTTLTINKPTGTVQDDLLLLLGGDDDNGASDRGFDQISGWTEEFDDGSRATAESQFNIQRKLAGGAEPSTYTWNKTSGDADEMWAWTARISGVDTTTPIDVVGGSNEGVSTAPTALSLTTTVDDCLIVAGHAFNGGDLHPTTVASPFTEESERTSGTASTDAGGTIASRSLASNGASGDCDFTTTASDGWVAAQIAIAPAAATDDIEFAGTMGKGSQQPLKYPDNVVSY